jgi:hypothetical protein
MNTLNVAVASDMRFIAGAIGTLASIRLCLEVHICLQVVFLHDGIDLETEPSLNFSFRETKMPLVTHGSIL